MVDAVGGVFVGNIGGGRIVVARRRATNQVEVPGRRRPGRASGRRSVLDNLVRHNDGRPLTAGSGFARCHQTGAIKGKAKETSSHHHGERQEHGLLAGVMGVVVWAFAGVFVRVLPDVVRNSPTNGSLISSRLCMDVGSYDAGKALFIRPSSVRRKPSKQQNQPI
jgi:hypothetical protein